MVYGDGIAVADFAMMILIAVVCYVSSSKVGTEFGGTLISMIFITLKAVSHHSVYPLKLLIVVPLLITG
jgi:hypothetical protein